MTQNSGRDDSVRRSATHQSLTFDKDGSFYVNEAVGSASISPGGRDIVLGSRQGLHIIDLDNPYSPPRFLPHHTPWEVADVQWSPFASRDYWVASTSNQKALIWNLELASSQIPIEHVLHGHTRAITDINFSAHEPDMLATCSVDSFVYCWDLRAPATPAVSFSEWTAGGTQVKWNRQNSNILASSHEKGLYVWDRRKSSKPLRRIEAHKSKIYGIDWSRVEATVLLTCSSDRTIKTWDYTSQEDAATKVMRTSYPIWRARHTPFGSGILAMPSRGNNDLHLYDQRLASASDDGSPANPVHLFTGHEDRVKEFLWRVRHGTEPGLDDRAFQLVSWGSDKSLKLHRIDEDLLADVGFQRGRPVDRRYRFTRVGASYRSFHTPPSEERTPSQALVSLFRKAELSGMSAISPGLTATQPGMRIRGGENRTPNAISWMKGVKIFNAKDDTNSLQGSVSQLTSSSLPPWDTPETLGDEITEAGEKFQKVLFEEVDVLARTIGISLNGPWGIEGGIVHVKVNMSFPKDYPEDASPSFGVEKTSSISNAQYTRMKLELGGICLAYQSIGRGCLEAALCYLLGERTLEESVRWIEEAQAMETSTVLQDDSSSDEEDGGIGFQSGNYNPLLVDGHGLIHANTNANVPLPKACGAIWAEDGRLVCFFPKKVNKLSKTESLDTTLLDIQLQPRSMFEAFGNLYNSNSRTHHGMGSVDSDSDMSTSSYTSSDESGSPGKEASFVPTVGHYHNAQPVRSTVPSINLSDQPRIKPTEDIHAGKLNTFVSIKTVDLLPAQKCLAQEYIIFGEGPKVCSHNAAVAAAHGFIELADVWNLLRLILCNDVPLEILPQTHRVEPILVLAKRAVVHIKRKDSGLILKFDQPDAVVKPRLTGRVKWGDHPLASVWLIDQLFDHYANNADVQMLAMLSCVLGEPATEDGALNAVRNLPSNELPMTMDAPGFSLDYFPNVDIAWSHFQGTENRHKARKPPNALPGTFGSFESSNGPWGSDGTQAGDSTARSSNASPPVLTRQNSHGSLRNVSTSFGTSTEHEIRRSNSINFAISFSKSLLFGTSQSPPIQRHQSAALSSSTPPGVSVSWTKRVFADDGMQARLADLNNNIAVHDEYEDSEGIFEWEEEEDVTVKLKNQNVFDDEACFSAPLLRPEDHAKHAGYRVNYANLLDVWNLPQQRCEILKFDGFTPYFSDMSLASQHRQSEVMSNRSQTAQRNASSEESKPSTLRECPGLRLAGYCGQCGMANPVVAKSLPRTATPPPTASTTGSKQEDREDTGPTNCFSCNNPASIAAITCSICFETIRGLYIPCLGCGHVSHVHCHKAWLDVASKEERDQCETGCGCDCLHYLTVDAGQLMGLDFSSEAFAGADTYEEDPSLDSDVDSLRVWHSTAVIDGGSEADFYQSQISRNVPP